MDQPELIVITGPTASGKSALAIDIARAVGTEVISADSRQIYKGIPVVTAMPSPEELAVVKHHLIDMLPLDAYYSAARFEEDALAIAEKLIDRNGSAIVCGGSMMYVDALCNGIDMLPTVPDSIRHDLEKEFEKKGGDWLREKLRLLDPEYYGIVDLCNTKRVFHAIEIILASGKTYTELRTGKKRKRPFRIKKYMTDLPREVLFDRINRRVDIMLENGLEEEARTVYHMRHLNSLNTVGLKEIFAWFEGTMDRDTAIARIKKNTRVYAKKQMTWWARDPEIVKGDPDTLRKLILPDSNA